MYDVSVIIPTYNNPDTLLNAVQSVVDHQPGLMLQVVVVDDASTNAHQLTMLRDLAQHGSRPQAHIQVVELQRGTGPVGAINAGCSKARGRYWIKLDADDQLEPNSLPCMVAALDDNPQVGFVYGCTQFHGRSGQYYKPPAYSAETFLHRNAAIGELMWRGPEWWHAGGKMRGFRQQDGREFGPHDWDHVLQMIQQGWQGLALQDVLVLHYNFHGQGASADTQRQMRETLAAFKQQWPQVRANRI